MIIRTIIFLLLSSPNLLQSQQNYVFNHLTSRDGLISEYVQTIFQDSKGFYWIGTTSGLQKFDGYTFSKPLKAGNDLMPSSAVIETRDGTIWISNKSSLFRYNQTFDRFTPLSPDGAKPKMNLHVMEDSAGNVWLLNYLFLYKYDQLNNKLITWLKLPESDPKFLPGAITFNKEAGIIWIQKGKTLYEISPGTKKIIKAEAVPYEAASLWADGKSYLWISYWTPNLCRYNLITGEKKWFTMPLTDIGNQNRRLAVATCFARDKSGRLWIGSVEGGLWFYDEINYKIIRLKSDNQKPELFHFNDMVYAITVDHAGSLLIGSDRGVNIFNPSYQPFKTINNSDLPTNGTPAFISQKPFETSTGDILISTSHGGWLLYDNKFRLKRSFTVIVRPNSSDIEKNKTTVTSFAEDKNGRIWIGHHQGLLGIYDRVTEVISYREVPEFKKLKISSIQCDVEGNMWFALRGSANNLVKWSLKTNKYKIYNDSLLMNRLQLESTVLITKQGEIWVQTFGNGIYRFDPVSEKIAEIYRDEQPPCFIPNDVQGISE